LFHGKGAAGRGPGPPHEFGKGVEEVFPAGLQGLEYIRGGGGVIDDIRDTGIMGDLCDGLEVVHIVLRVADRLAVNQAGVLIDRLADVLGVGGVDELYRDPQLRERVVEEIVGPAVEVTGGDDVLTGARDIENGIGGGRLTGRHR